MNPNLEVKNENFWNLVENPWSSIDFDTECDTPEPRKLQNSRNLDEICSHIGSFHHWELLPPEVQCMIIKEVEFVTRFSLLFCSKNLHKITRSVPVFIKSIDINIEEIDREREREDPYAGNYKEPDIITLVPKSDLGNEKVIFAFFEGFNYTCFHENWMKQTRKRKNKETMFLKFCNDRGELLDFVEYLLGFSNYQVDGFSFNYADWGEESKFLDKLQVMKKLKITFSYIPSLHRWLNTAKLPLEELEIESFFGYSSEEKFIERYNHDTVRNAKKLAILKDHFKNVSWLGLKCEILHTVFPKTGINLFLKQWKSGGLWENLKYLRIRCKSYVPPKDFGYFKWDDEFERENKLLSEYVDRTFPGKKECYNIESEKRNHGAIFIVQSRDCHFLVTGKRLSSLSNME